MVFLILILHAFYFVARTQHQSGWDTVFRNINAEVLSHSTAYTKLQQVTQTIGHRLTGTESAAKAEDYAYQLLESYGLNLRFQPFEAESWMRGSVRVVINGKTYKSVALAHTPVEADISGNLVDMGNGLLADYLRDTTAAKNKIVLVPIGILPGSASGLQNLHRSEKTALAIRFGAAGIIFINAAPDSILLTGTASVNGRLISIPAVCIGNDDGMQLKKQLPSTPAVARIAMANTSGKIKARNVIATLPGTTYPSEKIVIGAHLDSWDLATGAIDNGIGAFTVIDIVRTFKVLNLRSARTIEFVLFMGEEQGLLGSKAYVKEALADGTIADIAYMFNLDMSNNPKGFSSTTDADRMLLQAIGVLAKAVDSTFANTFRSGLGLHSDHQPFMLQGIPIAGVTGSLSGVSLQCYHADCDDFNLVNEQELRNTVRYSSMLLYGLANSPSLLAKRLSDEELKEALIKSGLEQPLRISGDWRW